MSHWTMLSRLQSIILGGVIVLVVVLGNQKRDLSERVVEIGLIASQPHAGMWLPPYELASIDGDTILLAPDAGSRQLFYFFTSTCEFCRASLDAWKDLSRLADMHDVQVVGVALDSLEATRSYRDEHGLPFPIVLLDDLRYARLYRANRVPVTMLVENAGEVSHVTIGEVTRPTTIDSVRTAILTPPALEDDAAPTMPIQSIQPE